MNPNETTNPETETETPDVIAIRAYREMKDAVDNMNALIKTVADLHGADPALLIDVIYRRMQRGAGVGLYSHRAFMRNT